jgi:hypothetical protein
MLTPAIKHTLKVIFVIIVISGLLASYLFTGAPQQQAATEEPVQEGFRFIGPATEPSAAGPAGAPTVNGPATPPPAAQ